MQFYKQPDFENSILQKNHNHVADHMAVEVENTGINFQ